MKHRYCLARPCLLLLSLAVFLQLPAQDAKSRARNAYRYQLQRIMDHVVPGRNDHPAALFMDMDTLPFFIMGQADIKLVKTDTLAENGNVHTVEMYDLDKDGRIDEFHILTKEGKPSPDFGFMYDLNGDGMVDYVVFWGGLMFSHDNDFYKFMYHWVDEDYDGNIDLFTSSVVNQPGDSMPDPHFVLRVKDTNADGAAEEVSFIQLPNGTSRPLAQENGKWYYETVFGRKEVDPGDKAFFSFYNRMQSKYRKF